jgi:hypothetical protein
MPLELTWEVEILQSVTTADQHSPLLTLALLESQRLRLHSLVSSVDAELGLERVAQIVALCVEAVGFELHVDTRVPVQRTIHSCENQKRYLFT